MWRHNEMRGMGTKRQGGVEIHGMFENNKVNGKGYKKWKRVSNNNGCRNKIVEFYLYRGMLKESRIEGQGEFKWPDGRHYIGEFRNSSMHGYGRLLWTDKTGGKCVYKGEFMANVFHGLGRL